MYNFYLEKSSLLVFTKVNDVYGRPNLAFNYVNILTNVFTVNKVVVSGNLSSCVLFLEKVVSYQLLSLQRPITTWSIVAVKPSVVCRAFPEVSSNSFYRLIHLLWYTRTRRVRRSDVCSACKRNRLTSRYGAGNF